MAKFVTTKVDNHTGIAFINVDTVRVLKLLPDTLRVEFDEDYFVVIRGDDVPQALEQFGVQTPEQADESRAAKGKAITNLREDLEKKRRR